MSTPGENRELARLQAIEIVRHFYGEPNRKLSNHREVRWFPHGGFVLYLDSGKWHSFSDGAHGDMADLVVRELGVDQKGALGWLADWIGVQKPTGDHHRRQEQWQTQFKATLLAAAKLEDACVIWNEAEPLLMTPAEAYLDHRLGGRPVPAPVIRSAQLRFHRTPLSQSLRERMPETAIGALVARMIDPSTGTFVGIQRTFLTWPQFGSCQKINRKMLGGSGVVKVVDRPHGDFALCEGLENGLSVLDFFGWDGPLWAAMVAGNMAKFPVLEEIPGITIFADHDKLTAHGRVGGQAAAECEARWRVAGREPLVTMPPDEGCDWNDYLSESRVEARG